MWEQEFLEKYNKLIGRENKAVKYFKEHPEKVTQKMINEYYKIVQGLSELIQEYRARFGQEMSEEEKLNGFKI